jgi:hypothetical protein
VQKKKEKELVEDQDLVLEKLVEEDIKDRVKEILKRKLVLKVDKLL